VANPLVMMFIGLHMRNACFVVWMVCDSMAAFPVYQFEIEFVKCFIIICDFLKVCLRCQ